MNKEAQSYEVAGYSDTDFGTTEAYKVIKQIFSEMARDAPAHAVRVEMTGDVLRVHYLTYVAHLPVHMKRIHEEAHDVLKNTVSFLKKEFKDRTKKTLKLKEIPELAGDAAEKVSLNERYYYKAWRCYSVDF